MLAVYPPGAKALDRLACLAPFPAVARLLAALRAGILAVLGPRLVGLYLYGSLAWGDFDPDLSDLDLMVTVRDDVTPADVAALRRMHEALVAPGRSPDESYWRDRVEVQYVPMRRLLHFRDIPFWMANISPGEPIHLLPAGSDWLTNWYFVQTYGVVLYGPPARVGARTEPMLRDEEFFQAVREHAVSWRTHIQSARENPAYQAYAVLTMCRALYTLTHGCQVSKQAAARWAAVELAVDAPLIRDALAWRRARGSGVDPATTYPVVAAFVRALAARIAAMPLPDGCASD